MVYGIIALIAIVAVLLNRRTAANPRTDSGLAGPDELSYLAGGRRRVVLSALAALRVGGAVSARHGRLWAVGPLPEETGPIGRAVYEAAWRWVYHASLLQERSVRAELKALRRRLYAAGLLLPPRRRLRIAAGTVGLTVLAVVGVAQIVTGLRRGDLVAFQEFAVVVVIATVLGTIRVPRISRLYDQVWFRNRCGCG